MHEPMDREATLVNVSLKKVTRLFSCCSADSTSSSLITSIIPPMSLSTALGSSPASLAPTSSFTRFAISQFVLDLNFHQDKEFVGLLEAAIKCIWCPKEYLESVVRDALLKKGRDEDALTRVIVTRSNTTWRLLFLTVDANSPNIGTCQTRPVRCQYVQNRPTTKQEESDKKTRTKSYHNEILKYILSERSNSYS